MRTSRAARRPALSAFTSEAASAWPLVGEAAIAVVHGIGEVSALNRRVAHEWYERHHAAARTMAQARHPLQFATVQAELARGDFEQGLLYWGELASMAGELQSELAAWSVHTVKTEDVFAGLRLLRTP